MFLPKLPYRLIVCLSFNFSITEVGIWLPFSELKDLDFDVSSGASVEASGNVNRVEADVSSGGAFNGRKLEAKHAEADVSSGGMIKIHCTESIEADASSGGSIKYYGDPKKKDVDAGYSGSIEKG